MRRTRAQTEREPTTALINIVFLILIFFMVTGSLAGPPPASPDYAESEGGDCCSPPDALVVMAGGDMLYQGQHLASPGQYLDLIDPGAPARLLPDKTLPAEDLLAVVAELQAAGGVRVVLMTENAPQ